MFHRSTLRAVVQSAVRLLCILLMASLGLEQGRGADAGAASPPDMHLSDSRLPAARLLDINAVGQLVVQSAGQTQAVPLSEIVRWGKPRAGSGSDLVWLADGSWLAGQIQWKNAEALELISDWFEPVPLELDQVRGFILDPPASAKGLAELQRQMQSTTGGDDVVWKRRSDEQLSGLLSFELRPAIEATLPPNPTWSLRTRGAADVIKLDSEDVRAIVLSPVLRSPPRRQPGSCAIGLKDFSQLNVAALERNAEARVSVRLTDRRVLQAVDAATQFVSSITQIVGDPERVQWVSDLEPAQYRLLHEDRELTWPLGRDRDLFGKPIFVEGEFVARGLVMHAPSQAAYRWSGGKARLLAELTVLGRRDDLSTEVGSVQCKVLVARGGKLVEVFQSPVLRPSSAPVAVEVDISDAQLIALLVEEADQGPVGDHALWREVRIVAPEPPE